MENQRKRREVCGRNVGRAATIGNILGRAMLAQLAQLNHSNSCASTSRRDLFLFDSIFGQSARTNRFMRMPWPVVDDVAGTPPNQTQLEGLQL